MMKYCVSFGLLMLSLSPVTASSEALSDPTRPPLGFNDAAPATAQASAKQARGLQSVIVSPGRCAAIIDGKTVALGSMHGGERLVEVHARGVVMQGERGRRSVSLFPAVGVKVTEALPQDKPAARCQLEQVSDMESPAGQMGQKEKK